MKILIILKYFNMLNYFILIFVIIMCAHCDFVLVFILNLFTYLH